MAIEAYPRDPPPPPVLYKYFSVEGAVRLFSSMLIRFTQPSAFNDVFELMPSFASLRTHGGIETFTEAVRNEAIVTAALGSRRINLKRFASRTDEAIRAAKIRYQRTGDLDQVAQASLIRHSDSEVGILCLTETDRSPVMWEHYGKGHTGVCVGFNTSHAFFRYKPHDSAAILDALKPVQYRRERISIVNKTDPDYANLPFVKNDEWAYEREWRVLRWLKSASKIVSSTASNLPIHLFSLPPEVVASCTFGLNTEESVSRELKSHFKKNLPLGAKPLFRVRRSLEKYEMQPFTLSKWRGEEERTQRIVRAREDAVRSIEK